MEVFKQLKGMNIAVGKCNLIIIQEIMKRGPIQKKLLTNYCQYLSLGGGRVGEDGF